jgi:hypothetical protein
MGGAEVVKERPRHATPRGAWFEIDSDSRAATTLQERMCLSRWLGNTVTYVTTSRGTVAPNRLRNQ